MAPNAYRRQIATLLRLRCDAHLLPRRTEPLLRTRAHSLFRKVEGPVIWNLHAPTSARTRVQQCGGERRPRTSARRDSTTYRGLGRSRAPQRHRLRRRSRPPRNGQRSETGYSEEASLRHLSATWVAATFGRWQKRPVDESRFDRNGHLRYRLSRFYYPLTGHPVF